MAIDTVFVSYTSSPHMIACHTSINPPSSQLHCIVSTKGDRELTSRLGELRVQQQMQSTGYQCIGIEKKLPLDRGGRHTRKCPLTALVYRPTKAKRWTHLPFLPRFQRPTALALAHQVLLRTIVSLSLMPSLTVRPVHCLRDPHPIRTQWQPKSRPRSAKSSKMQLISLCSGVSSLLY